MADSISPTHAVTDNPPPGYRNPGLPIEERVADLLRLMTLEEKVAQMLCIWGQKKAMFLNGAGHPDPAALRHHLPHGIGQIARLGDIAGGLGPRETAELANAIQKVWAEETRLGIPVMIHEECLHGLAARDATSYPQPIGLASTFDLELVEEIYSAVARATRARGVHQALTPVIDVARDPRWGRVEETFGEDPYLVSQMGIAAVRGFQGDRTFRSKDRVVATLKHFAAHGQPEAGINAGPGNFSERELRDVFLSPFQAVLKNGKALSVMASYNEIDGVPSHANRWLLRDVLRGDWGFDGFVVSDYYGITELHKRDESTSHSVAGNKAEAAVLAVQAGVNIELPDPDCYPSLLQLVRDGNIQESAVDELVAPLLKSKFMLGLFEDPYVNPEDAQREEILNREQALALRAAREAITLLKNESGVLPLNRASLRTLAVIGPNADRAMLGGYTGTPPYCTTVLQGIRELVGKEIAVLHAEGCKITIGGSWNEDVVTPSDPDEDMRTIAEAAVTARRADVVILVLGGNEQTSREGWSRTHLGDRASLDLVGAQNDLVKAVMEAGKPVIALLFNGRPNSITTLQKEVDAILECWYLGQEGGRAVAEVLFGDAIPSGKLAISIPRSAGHLPCFYNHKPSARRGYLFDDVTQLYPFGFGLSYTTFRFANPRLERSIIRAGESSRILVDLTNTGMQSGDEVVQLYVRDLVSSVTRPVKELKGFVRVHLSPGETRTVALPIRPEHLAFTTIRKEFAVEPGEFSIMVGNSSRDRDLMSVLLTVTGTEEQIE